jgi:hypothetical protein
MILHGDWSRGSLPNSILTASDRLKEKNRWCIGKGEQAQGMTGNTLCSRSWVQTS